MTTPPSLLRKKSSDQKIFLTAIAVPVVICCAFLFLSRSATIAEGIGDGLFVCTNIILPSLFCFMILTNFVVFSGLSRVISPILSPITYGLFRLDKSLGCIVLMSLIGGYPIGANAIASMVKEGTLSSKTAQRMMCFCCCAAPSFVITAVGSGMFSNAKTGVLLYTVQVVSSAFIGVFVSFKFKPEAKPAFKGEASKKALPKAASFGEALVTSVNNAVVVMAQMFGYILLFSAVLSLLKELAYGPIMAIAPGFLEVTTGCKSASEISGIWGLCTTSFFLSFGGASVLCQIAGILKGSGVSMKPVVGFRILHGLLSFAITYIYTRLCPDILPTFSGESIFVAESAIVPVINHNTPILTSCLLVMCGMMLIASSQAGLYTNTDLS